MKRHASRWVGILCMLLSPLTAVPAADGRLEWVTTAEGPGVRVRGDGDDDWLLQESADLATWTSLGQGPVLGGRSNPPIRLLGSATGPTRFVRAVKTGGLFDDTLVRTITLTFGQANWQSLLTTSRSTGSNTVGALALDNGAAIPGIGARYKGNTSFSGMGSVPTKKSVNLTIDQSDPTADIMGYETLNLNNAYGDETILREPVYFNVMRRYTVCPRASLARLVINGTYWGLYSFVQQEDGDLIDEWFPSNDGDRWRAPNIGGGAGAGGGPPGGGPGGGGGFSSGGSALSFLGTNVSSYAANYELKKSSDSTNAWRRLVNVINVLNNTPSATFRDKVEEVLAVDRWLWFLAVENVFADDDSYFNKGADYMMYFEPESGRLHPVEHDGNESFVAGDLRLSPVQGATGSNRPVLQKLLAVPELRQRYLAHMRTVLDESFRPDALFPLVERYRAMTIDHVIADTKKGYTMTAYTNDLAALKSFVTQRYAFLTNHAELRPSAPKILALRGPTNAPTAAEGAVVVADVRGADGVGVDSVWLYHRAKSYGRFDAVPMYDDGAHGDGAAGDGTYGGTTTNYPAGSKVRYYVEARSANTAKAAAFFPPRAEQEVQSYRVAVTTAPDSPVVIEEFLAANVASHADPQGDFDDWIELHNVTDAEVDLTGRYLSDEPNNPRKWAFPDGTRIPAGGYLIVWADEDGSADAGLHASFKLDKAGEQILLTDTDARLNAILDSVTFGPQEDDRSYGRTAADADVWAVLTPTPGAPNP